MAPIFIPGLLAIRACVSAGVNITYKILYNDAVAMTGGQSVDGPMDVATDLAAGVCRRGDCGLQSLPTSQTNTRADVDWAPGVTVHHRDELMRVQREFREIPGTSAIIFDQTCAAEKRRRRRRGQMETPHQRLFINEAVCDACGDCGTQSNCVAIVPTETSLGRKRAIDQSSCNMDYSCQKGFLPELCFCYWW